jgi:glycosyltransferase involved in cell wall biosynthesis
MKILQINKYFYQKGGAETVFFNTIHLLEQYGHTVIPFSLKNDKNVQSKYDSYFVDYPELSESNYLTRIGNIPSFIYNREAAKQLDNLIKNEKPDIAHIHLMFNSLSVSILPVLKKHNIPVVMSLHDHRLICPAYVFIDGKGNLCERCLADGHYWHCITNRCSKGNLFNSIMLTVDSYFRKYFISPFDFVDKFIFVGEYARNMHIKVSPSFEKKSVVLNNFTTIPVQAPSQQKGNFLLYFGRISEEKGIPVLIKAMRDIPDVNLKIVGCGPLLDELKKHSYHNIEFVGYKSGNELHDYIRQARFIVVPSVCYENNTMVIPEGFTLGTPPIASSIGGIPEFIQEGVTGFLFEPGSVDQLKETIQKALNLQAVEYSDMCKSGNLFAKSRFAPEIYYNKLISIYNDVINERKQ